MEMFSSIRSIIYALMLVPLAGLCEVMPGEIDFQSPGLISKVAERISSLYLHEHTGKSMADYILQRQAQGAYENMDSATELCTRLTSDLRQIQNDKHLWVFQSPEEAREVRARNKLLPANEIQVIEDAMDQLDAASNYGFGQVEVLPGNIGYVDIDYFTNPEAFDRKLREVMHAMVNTQSLIIDLRDNGGGEGSTMLFSYLLPDEHLDIAHTYCRDESRNGVTSLEKDFDEPRLLKQDVYVLVNANTFSAAEFVAYTLKHLGRAVLIGETTKGGAHPVDVVIVQDDILMQIPICESHSPLTGDNWEEKGVSPHIRVSSDLAMDKAMELIKRRYFGQKRPGLEPEVFAPGFVSTAAFEFSGVFNQEMTEYFFTRRPDYQGSDNRILHSRWDGQKWTEPELAPFARSIFEFEPMLINGSADLVFYSDRDKPGGIEAVGSLWVTGNRQGQWSEPMFFDHPANSLMTMSVTQSDSGTMYFSGSYQGRRGIFSSQRINGAYEEPVFLEGAINDRFYSHPFVAPDESLMLMDAQIEGRGKPELFVSFKDASGKWMMPRNLGPVINKTKTEFGASLSPGGRFLFFHRRENGNGEIYWVDSSVLRQLGPQ